MHRCARHHLVAGPDGRCVICRREAPPEKAASRSATAWVFGGLAALALLIAFLAFKPSRAPVVVATAETPATPTTPERHAAPGEPRANGEHALPAGTEPAPPQMQKTIVTEAPSAAPVASAPAPPTPAEARAALGQVSIKVYSTSWCPNCKKARAWLAANKIQYTEYDVDHDPDAKRRQLQLNPSGSVPTIEVDGAVLVGFGEQSMGAAIQRAVDRRLATR